MSAASRAKGHYWVKSEGKETIALWTPREPHWMVTGAIAGHWTWLGLPTVEYERDGDDDIEVLAGPLSLSVERTVNALQRRIEGAAEELSRESMGMTVRALEILKGNR
jgi:hypothetical protein